MHTPSDQADKLHPRHLIVAMLLAAVLLFCSQWLIRQLRPKPIHIPQLAASAQPPRAPASDPNETELKSTRAAIKQHEQTLIEKDRVRREEKLQEALAAREQSAEMARLDQEHKEQAWKHFYKPSRKCRHPLTEKLQLSCDKNKEQERQRFETLWQEGKIVGR